MENTPKIDWLKATKTVDGYKVLEIHKVADGYFGLLQPPSNNPTAVKWDSNGIALTNRGFENFRLVPPKSEYEQLVERLNSVTHTRGGYEVLQVIIPKEEIWNIISGVQDAIVAVIKKDENVFVKNFYKEGNYYNSAQSVFDLIY